MKHNITIHITDPPGGGVTVPLSIFRSPLIFTVPADELKVPPFTRRGASVEMPGVITNVGLVSGWERVPAFRLMPFFAESSLVSDQVVAADTKSTS